jgi:hypothetical protein
MLHDRSVAVFAASRPPLDELLAFKRNRNAVAHASLHTGECGASIIIADPIAA